MSPIENRVENLAAPVAGEHGVRIYDVEYRKEGAAWVLRIFIYGENGVNIDDCENVSRGLGEILDREDFIKEAYMLEVSSPGLDRSLTRDWHFEISINQPVTVKLFNKINEKKKINGILKVFDGESATVEEDGEEIVVKRDNISKINLIY